MSLRTWLLLALGMLLAQAVMAQEKMRTYDPNNAGARRQSLEPPLADGSEPVKPAPAPPRPTEPRKLPSGMDGKFDPEGNLLPAQSITPTQGIISVPNPQGNPPPINYLATPVVTIDVIGSENAAENTEVKYTFTVRNRSEAKAHHVLVRGIVPRNAKFIKASLPEKEEKVGETTELHWPIGTLNPNESRSIEVFFRPNDGETEIKVLGRVQFDHGRWLVTKIAKPGLSVKKIAPKEGVLYDALSYRIEVSNPSKITLTDVRIEDQLGKDDGMEYDRDANAKIDLEKNQRTWSLPSLAPGEKKVFDFTVIAKKPGAKRSLVRVTASGLAPVVEPHEITIVEARLQMKLTPPPQATVNQPARMELLVENKGTATLNNVRVNIGHPQDLEVRRATQGSQFFKDGVQWIIPKLAAGENRAFNVEWIAKTPGRRKLTSTARANRGPEQQDETAIDFEGVATLNWKTSGTPSSTEGKGVNYVVEVYNPGTANATNVVLQVKIPAEVRLESADPLYDTTANGVVTFRPLHIPPQKKVTFVVNGLAQKKGVATFHFDLLADHTKKAGSQHNEVTTTIHGREVPKQLDRTTQVPKDLPLKDMNRPELKEIREPIVPVKTEPKIEPKVEPKIEPKSEPKKEPVPVPKDPKAEPKGELKKEPSGIPPLEVTPLAPIEGKKVDDPKKPDPIPIPKL